MAIDCGQPAAVHSGCTESYSDTKVVTLNAHRGWHSDFAGFSGGGCSGSVTTCVRNQPVATSTSVNRHLHAEGGATAATPSNAFTIDTVKRNTKNGTANNATVPGPGELALSGKLAQIPAPPRAICCTVRLPAASSAGSGRAQGEAEGQGEARS